MYTQEMGTAKKKGGQRSYLLSMVWILILFLGINGIAQIFLKPMEIVRFLSWSKSKKLMQTWTTYGEDFKRYATQDISADLLAAIAQTESAGDPLA